MKFGLAILGAWITTVSWCQFIDQNYYQRITLADNQKFMVSADSIYIDTLVMGDRSHLAFLSEYTKLIIEHSFIGFDCTFDASGADGLAGSLTSFDGTSGSPGRNLNIVIVFDKLGSLFINTQGGSGGDALRHPDAAVRNRLPVAGGNGGIGGDGGDIAFFYSANGFIPVFHEERDHSIRFNCAGGQGGLLGFGSKRQQAVDPTYRKDFSSNPNGVTVLETRGLPPVDAGRSGTSGANGQDGVLFFKPFK